MASKSKQIEVIKTNNADDTTNVSYVLGNVRDNKKKYLKARKITYISTHGLPKKYDLRKLSFKDKNKKIVQFPEVYDQKHLGTCNPNAIAFCYQYDLIKEKLSFGKDESGKDKSLIPSRLFLYYTEREIEGRDTSTDNGASIYSSINALTQVGICSDSDWSYDDKVPYYDFSNLDSNGIPTLVENDGWKDKPSEEAYRNAGMHKLTRADKIDSQAVDNTINTIKNMIYNGFPIIFAFDVYKSFGNITSERPVMPKPDIANEEVQGGHAVVIVGYNDFSKWFVVRNSWGSNWGLKGYYYLPYSYLTNKDLKGSFNDFWSITKVS